MSTTSGTLLFAAGYRDLVSVVPPGAKLSSKSEIPDGSDPAKADQRGKAPGRYDGNRGDWAGYNWRELKPFPAHIEMWEKAGANIGMPAKAFPAIDIDCLDEELVLLIEQTAHQVLGPAPVRIGRAPKALLVYSTATPFTRLRVHLKRGDEKGLIEILGDGQQYLVAGTHPGTMKPYEWIGKPLHEWDPLDDLATIDLAKVEAFLEQVELVCGLEGWECEREGKGRVVSEGGAVQDHLAAPSLEALQAVVAAIPNTSDAFPSRDAMNEVGYAIKASGGEQALPLFLEFTGRWVDGSNDPDYVQHEWDRMVPPFRIGYEWLVSKAKQLSGFDDAAADFEAVEAPEGFQAPDAPADDFDAIQAPPGGSPPPSGPSASGKGSGDGAPAPAKYTDHAVALRFRRTYENAFRYVENLGGWQAYSPKRGTWAPDETHKAEAAMQFTCRQYAEEAQTDSGLNAQQRRSIIFALLKAGTVTSGLKLARALRPIAGLRADNFDRDLMSLNTPAGLVDLRTGAVSEHAHENLVTKSTAVAPAEGKPVKWLRFLDEALGGDQELIDYMQILAGYWLTGETSEQQLAFIWGTGGNGKGVFANTIADVMGDYATRTSNGTFAEKKHESHPTDMAALRGARLVLSTETQEGQAWDNSKVKTATGGDVITARFMGKDFFNYLPQFKLLFLGNHKPRIRNLDDAMKRRIHLVPMTVKPREVNRRLPQELKAEWPQILQWAIDGCVRWQQQGLKIPRAVIEATQEYFGEEDVLGQFMEDCCTVDPKGFTTSMALWKAWVRWCETQGEPERTQTWLSRQVGARPGVDKVKRHPTLPKINVRGFVGFSLNDDDEFETQPAPGTEQKQKAR